MGKNLGIEGGLPVQKKKKKNLYKKKKEREELQWCLLMAVNCLHRAVPMREVLINYSGECFPTLNMHCSMALCGTFRPNRFSFSIFFF